MTKEGSVTKLIHQLKTGDTDAAAGVWERYYKRLVALCRIRLRDIPRRAADEEDVALDAFDSFFRGAKEGRFPKLGDRDDLWQILVMIAARKSFDLKKHHRREKRGGGKIRGESVFASDMNDGGKPRGIGESPGEEPTPETAAVVAEEFRRLFAMLEDPSLRRVAIWKMEGYTVAEIAERMDRTTRTVEYKLKRIRDIWGSQADEDLARD